MRTAARKTNVARFIELIGLAALMLGLTTPSASAAIVLRIVGDQVVAGETASIGFFLDDTDANPLGLDLEGFNIPVLLDGLPEPEPESASEGFFGPSNLIVAPTNAPNVVDRSDVLISQDEGSGGFRNTGASAKLFQLQIMTSLTDAGQSFTISTDPASFFVQLNTTSGNVPIDSVIAGTIEVVAVPEPISGIALLGLTGIMWYKRHSRGRRPC